MKILELGGDEAFFGDIGRVKKLVKMSTKSMKNRGVGREQNLDGFGAVFDCFCCVRQDPKQCKLQCFCTLRLTKK